MRTLLIFSIPIFIGQLLQMTYNIADSVVVGRFIGEAELAAVGTTYTPVYLFNALVIGFTTGSSILMAQYFGAGRETELRRTASTSYIYIFVGGLLMSGVVFLCARPLLRYALKVPEDILEEAVLYLRVYYLGAVFVFLYNFFAAALRALGDSVRPLWFLFISCAANVLLDLLFVVGFKWGVAGAAAATVTAQGLACLAALLYIRKRYAVLWFKPREFRFDREIFVKTVGMGVPEAIQQGVMSVGFMWQQRIVNSFGATTIAAFLAGQRVDQLVGMPIIVMGSAMAPFAGQNIGAGRTARILEGRRKMLLLLLGFCAVSIPFLLYFGRSILSMFVADAESGVITQGYEYLWRIAPFYFCLAYSSVTAGVMRGAGDVRFATFSSMLGLAARIGAAYLLAFGFGLGYKGVWLSTGVGFAVNVVPVAWRYHSGRWKEKAVVKAEEPSGA